MKQKNQRRGTALSVQIKYTRAICATRRLATATDSRTQLSLYADVLSIYSTVYGIWKDRGIVQDVHSASPVIQSIRDYVANNYAREISAQQLARQLNISYSYLAKIMTREFGTSFGKYIITHRIENAKKLLLSTENSIAEIGYACGFASSSAFISHFKARTGKTPLVFRNEALEP